MLLIPSRSYRAPDFMSAARKLGIDVVVAADAEHPPQESDSGKQLTLNFSNVEISTDRIEDFDDRFPLRSIVAVDDAGARVAASASRRLELPHNPVRAVDATRDKALLRQALAASDVPSPAFRAIPTTADPNDEWASLPFPVVLKPLALSASRGVIRANNKDEFYAAFERIRDILALPANADECGDTADRILIEGYLPGAEVAVEGLLLGGKLNVLAVFDKPDPLEGPFFEETIYITPSRLPAEDLELVIKTSERACAALGLTDGPTHLELRLNEDGAFPIDIAARSVGGLCSRTLTFGTGLSLEELILRQALGEEPGDLSRSAGAAGVMMIPIPGRGRLTSVSGVDKAEAVPFVDSVSITMPPGSSLTPLPEGSEYLGFIFARDQDPDVVEQALRLAHGELSFDID